MAVDVRHRTTGEDILAGLLQGDLDGFFATSLSTDAISSWRKQSFAQARELPTPTNKDEDFKYVSFRRLNLTDLNPVEVISAGNGNGAPATELKAGIEELGEIPDRLKIEASTESDREGCFFGSLTDAGIEIPEQVEKFLGFCDTKFTQRKFVYLSHAYLSNGSFLYLPPDHELEHPKHTYTLVSGERALTSYAAIVAAERHARASLVWDLVAKPDASGMFNGTLDVIALEGSKVSLMVNQELTERLDGVLTIRAYLERSAELELVTLNSEGQVVQVEVDVQMAGPGARAVVNGVYVGRNRENFNFLTHQDHRIGDTNTDLYFAGTLSGRSNANYLGKIKIAENAQRSDAYQTNRNLVLNRGVRVNSSPKLEISANDVRCSHGATTARVSDEEMFYLRSRGISADQSRVLLADGFLEQVRGRITNAALKEAFAARLNWSLMDRRDDES